MPTNQSSMGNVMEHLPGPSVGLSVHNNWIWMPFWTVGGVGECRCVLDGVIIIEGKGQLWG